MHVAERDGVHGAFRDRDPASRRPGHRRRSTISPSRRRPRRGGRWLGATRRVEAQRNTVPGIGMRQLFFEDPNGVKIEINVMPARARRSEHGNRQRRRAGGGYRTTAGPTQPHQGQEWSNFDFGDRCAEAAKAGMKGIGIWHADLVHEKESRGLAEMKQLLDDNGLQVPGARVHLGLLRGRGHRRRARRRTSSATCCSREPQRSAPTTSRSGTSPAFPRARPADRALRGALRPRRRADDAVIAYEFMPFDVNVDNLEPPWRSSRAPAPRTAAW